ncbi:hypothetical protein OH77DRAFT_1582440 [Trametes cingulata]|nr:hypothetical protein OH77DRAFT_1582440 [Trametes cingulata]
MSPLYPIAQFWTTAVMNYISPTSFCIAYPQLTCFGLALLSPARAGRQFAIARSGVDINLLRKYERRGFRFMGCDSVFAAGVCRPGAVASACASTVCFFGDEHCLSGTVSTPPAFSHPVGSSHSDVEQGMVTWWLGGYACGEECRSGEGWVEPGAMVTGTTHGCRLMYDPENAE